ncbi:DUF2805 domain-containing protein [Roseateles violae]|uniref:DUF2805 domain-containing protein n=1 Tax=Roseateles violae TaxID=3058042 RepID=A0ABT8DM82_9BURK|nr:DUF2805 domain-containing protein [Pelomonas sp. PFR6]MDN3919101.1 DUF2805 domain-containing protein [Pelomonas sp. PFR6]
MAKLPPRLSPEETQRVVATAWDDLPPYNRVLMEHGIGPGELVALMKRALSPAAYKQWAARAKAAKAPTVKARWPYGR